MAGCGAWPFVYKFGLDFRNDPQGRSAHGIYALKKELVFNGYSIGIVVDLAYWGDKVDKQTKKFQTDHALTVDGQLGPQTALALFKKRAVALQKQYGIKNNWLCKQKTLESSNDPVCEGSADPDDEGIAQINLHFHPEITYEEAWSPAFALEYAAKFLVSAISYCGDEEGGVAAYNIGRYYAKEWVDAGKPASGGPFIGSQDVYARATHYVAVVQSAGC